MIPSEREPRAGDAYESAGDNVEAEVPELYVAGRGDVSRNSDRDQDENQAVVRRSSGLVIKRCHSCVLSTCSRLCG